MKFRTEIKLSDAPFSLNPERLVLLLGSCFADNIGDRIAGADWKCTVNPCGVVYNPTSMAILFQLALSDRISRRLIIEQSVTEREGVFVSWFMDSGIASKERDGVVDKAMEALDRLENAIEQAECLILTFGTSEVYLLKDTDRAVGNCHKHPAGEFQKRQLGIGEIVETWIHLIQTARIRNPRLKVVFTVSPLRYLGDGFAQNSRKKAVLLLACAKLEENLENSCYFPAFEILNDDLRDYRFYAEDLLHPSRQAVNYIWEIFCGYFLTEEGCQKVRAGEKAMRRLNHRPIIS